MATPLLNVHLNKGRHGVPLEKLGAVARETVIFLTKLSIDLGDPESTDNWIAEDFSSQSVLFKVRRSHESRIEPSVWDSAFHAVVANDFSDPVLNARISPDTRAQFWRITQPIDENESITLGIENSRNGAEPKVEWFDITKEMAMRAEESLPEFFSSYGEIQGYVHALYKEADRPKLVVRELSTRNLVHCFFTPEQYEAVVDLLEDKEGIIFVEGEVREDPTTGLITEIEVENFTPAPDFNPQEFESLIGSFGKKTDGK
jgi:hypothetical protein